MGAALLKKIAELLFTHDFFVQTEEHYGGHLWEEPLLLHSERSQKRGLECLDGMPPERDVPETFQ